MAVNIVLYGSSLRYVNIDEKRRWVLIVTANEHHQKCTPATARRLSTLELLLLEGGVSKRSMDTQINPVQLV